MEGGREMPSSLGLLVAGLAFALAAAGGCRDARKFEETAWRSDGSKQYHYVHRNGEPRGRCV